MMASSQSFSRIHWRMLLSPCPASPVNNAEPLWTVESNIRQWILENDWLEADRKSTRLNSNHLGISYAVFFLKKKTGSYDFFVSKLDSSGNFIWVKTGGGTGQEYSSFITLDHIDNIYVAGNYQSSSVAFDATLITNFGGTNTFIGKLDNIVGLYEQDLTNSVILFPNPFSSSATLTFNTNNFSEGTIEIKNILGASVSPPKHFSGNTIQLQRNNLPSGIYFYTVTTKANQILNGKFIID